MKIKLSKSDWELIGQKTGWLKTAMPKTAMPMGDISYDELSRSDKLSSAETTQIRTTAKDSLAALNWLLNKLSTEVGVLTNAQHESANQVLVADVYKRLAGVVVPDLSKMMKALSETSAEKELANRVRNGNLYDYFARIEELVSVFNNEASKLNAIHESKLTPADIQSNIQTATNLFKALQTKAIDARDRGLQIVDSPWFRERSVN